MNLEVHLSECIKVLNFSFNKYYSINTFIFNLEEKSINIFPGKSQSFILLLKP